MLPGTTLSVSALGFGCASLMARIKQRESVGLLETAFEAGITHFDVARSYGYGEAEKALGAFIADKREQVTVTTKLGILPPKRSLGLDVAKVSARRLVQLFPGIRSTLRDRASRLVTAGNFSVEAAERSLTTSLKELKTDYVDLLLLHECSNENLSDELLEFLNSCVERGVARAFGVATTPEATQHILTSNPSFVQVAQFPSSIFNDNLSAVRALTERAIVTHSVLGGTSTEQLTNFIIGSPERVHEWSEEVGVDFSKPQVITRLVLAQAIHANTRGIVVFSSLNPQHIRANARTAVENDFTPKQFRIFEKLVRTYVESRKIV